MTEPKNTPSCNGDNGGPAFPRPVGGDGYGATSDEAVGMTLLDYFAGQALVGMLAQWAVDDNATPEYRHVALHAYTIASAMLAEKRRREREGE
jgi:hypothetical protein